MKRLLMLLLCAIVLINNSLSASGEISISTPRPVIMLTYGVAHVVLNIKIQNHKGNRKLRLDWEIGATEIQLNNFTDKEFDGSRPFDIDKKDEYIFFTDDDLRQSIIANMGGLLLPAGQYDIRATLTRIVDGKEREFNSKVQVTIGLMERKE